MGEFINFVEIGGYAICASGLRGVDAPAEKTPNLTHPIL